MAPALRMVYPVHRVRRTAGRSNEVQISMTKTLTTFTAAAAVAAALMAAPSDANAQFRRWGPAAIIGGVAAGAIIGGAIASTYGPAYVVQPGYVVYPGYAYAPPVACPGGYWARIPVYDAYGNVIGWRGRPRFFCPG